MIDKTEFLTVGTRQQLAKVNNNCIRAGSTNVCPVTVARNLGSWFDEQLTMSTHISKLCGVAFYHLHNIKRIRKYLSRESTEMLDHAFLTPRVDYCNSLLYGLPNYQLNKLQRVLNASARLACFIMRIGFATSHPFCVVCIGYLLKPGCNLRYCLWQFTALPLNIYAIY